MKQILFSKPLSVRRSPIHRYGVYADHHISKGEIIEECMVMVVNADEHTSNSQLTNYFFQFSDKQHLLVFGYGSLYNHSQQPNADYAYDPETSLMTFIATNDIRKDDEIFVSYGDNWFSARNIKPFELKRRLQRWPYAALAQTLFRFTLVTGMLTLAIVYMR